MVWSGWPLQRMLVAFVGVAYAMLLGQVYLFHDRQNFRHWAMPLPVLGAAAVALASLALSLMNTSWLVPILNIILAIAAVEGVIGLYYHLTGVGNRIGGYVQQNFEKGPPPFLPVVFSALAVLGFLALWWR
ncbi:MAG: hypothetical protein ACM3ZQ_07125 [Bacillota bacterium]